MAARVAGLVLVTALVVLLAAAPNAVAGTYTVDTCASGSLSGWTHFNFGEWSSYGNGCGVPGSGLAASTWTPAGSSAGWTFTAPADTEIAGFRLARSFTLPGNRPYGTGVASLRTDGPGRGFSEWVPNYSASPLVAPAESRATSGLTGQRTLTASVDCGGGLDCSGAGQLLLYDPLIDLRDDLVPSVGSVSGTLLGSGPMKGTRTLSYAATDRGGGLRREVLAVDGAPRSDRALDCSFAKTVPCPQTVSGSVKLDTTALPDGEHEVEFVLYDATLANRGGYGPFSITVDNVPAPSATQAPRVYGTATVGTTLYADDGTWSGAGLTLTRRWQRSDGNAWESIEGATQPGYAVSAGDVGHRLRFAVQARNDEGSTDAVSLATAPVPGPSATATPTPTPTASPTATPATTPATPVPLPAVLGERAAPGGIPTAAFASTGRPTITLRWGETRKVTGTLLAQDDGRPLANARLTVSSRVLTPGARPLPLGQVTTDGSGRFVYQPAPGASRAIGFGFGSRTATVTARVIPRVTISLGRDGRARGRVSGAPPGSRKVVDLQRLSGHSWRTFATTRLRAGSYSAQVPSTIKRVRALIRPDAQWPFVTGRSAAAVRR